MINGRPPIEEAGDVDYIQPQKFRFRKRLIAADRHKYKVIEFIGGVGHLTRRIYLPAYRRLVVVEMDEENYRRLARTFRRVGNVRLYHKNNLAFIKEDLRDHLDFTAVDFDAYGIPNEALVAFFQAIARRKKRPFLLIMTDGGPMAAWRRVRINLWRKYLIGPDRVTRFPPGVYWKYEAFQKAFIKRLPARYGFTATPLGFVWGFRKTVVYSGYMVRKKKPVVREAIRRSPSAERSFARLRAVSLATREALTINEKKYVRQVYRGLERARRDVRRELALELGRVGPEGWTYRKVRLPELMKGIDKAMAGMVAEHGAIARDAVEHGYHYGWMSSQKILAGAGVEVAFIGVDPARAAAVTELPLAGLPMSERFRMAGPYVHRKILGEMTHSLLLGEGYKKCERRVVKATGIPAETARRVVSTGMTMANGLASQENYKRLGVERWEWGAGPGACEVCASLAGTRYDIETPFETQHLCCRCFMVPVLGSRGEVVAWVQVPAAALVCAAR